MSSRNTSQQPRWTKAVLLLAIVTLCLLVGACSTTPQPKAALPPPPATLMVPPPGTLEKVPPVASPRQSAEVVTRNYGTYHETADRLRKLQQWVAEQFNPSTSR